MNWIKKAMDEKEVSIEELADALGLTWGHGKKLLPGMDQARQKYPA